MRKYNYELDYSRIKELRMENNLTQKDIADILNINQSTYSKFELIKSSITITNLNKLANYYLIIKNLIKILKLIKILLVKD